MANLVAGANQTATVPVKVIPSGLSCGVQVFLALDAAGANVKAQSAIFPFVSTGSLQLVAVPLIAPAAGTYYVFVAIYINGIDVGVWASGTVVVIATAVEITGVTVNPIILTTADHEYNTSLGLGYWGDPFTISIAFKNPFPYNIWVRPDYAFGRLTGEPLEYVDGVLQGFTAEELLYVRLLLNTAAIQGDYSYTSAWQKLYNEQNYGSNMSQFILDPDGIAVLAGGGDCWLKVPALGTATTVKQARLSSELEVKALHCVLCGEIIIGSVEEHYANNHPGIEITCWAWGGYSGCYFTDGSGEAVISVDVSAPGVTGPKDLCVVANKVLYLYYEPHIRIVGGVSYVINWKSASLDPCAAMVPNQITIV